jgi:hypothetical protein
MDRCLSEEEVCSIIRDMPPDKALEPDGFTGRFFQTAWPVIKRNVMHALTTIWSLDGRNLYLLKQAYIVLLRKKKDTEEIKNFRPISLIHNFSKLFAKMLSSRLAPHMHRLVLHNQSAFIRGRAIHDNFRAVHSSVKLLRTCGISCILLKVDIAKTFDTVNWSFLHDLLTH